MNQPLKNHRRFSAIAFASVVGLATLVGGSVLPQTEIARDQDEPYKQVDQFAKAKADALLNFVRFTYWAPDHFATPDSPIVLTIIGPDSLGTVLDHTFDGKRLHQRQVKIQRLEIPDTFAEDPMADEAVTRAFTDALRHAHLVYLTHRDAGMARPLSELLRDHPTITIGDSPDHARRGCMLAFMIEEQRLVFTANHDRIADSGLRLSSKLLQLARPLPNE